MTMLAQAAPLPDLPQVPPPPAEPLDVIVRTPGGPFDMLPAPVVVLLALAFLAAVTAIAWPLVRAVARRIEGGGGMAEAERAELEELRHRVAELEERQGRLAEIEERLDFTERLLAERGREATRLGRGEA